MIDTVPIETARQPDRKRGVDGWEEREKREGGERELNVQMSSLMYSFWLVSGCVCTYAHLSSLFSELTLSWSANLLRTLSGHSLDPCVLENKQSIEIVITLLVSEYFLTNLMFFFCPKDSFYIWSSTEIKLF